MLKLSLQNLPKLHDGGSSFVLSLLRLGWLSLRYTYLHEEEIPVLKPSIDIIGWKPVENLTKKQITRIPGRSSARNRWFHQLNMEKWTWISLIIYVFPWLLGESALNEVESFNCLVEYFFHQKLMLGRWKDVTNIQPIVIGSMYGLLTYIGWRMATLKGKCRFIFPTWILWDCHFIVSAKVTVFVAVSPSVVCSIISLGRKTRWHSLKYLSHSC